MFERRDRLTLRERPAAAEPDRLSVAPIGVFDSGVGGLTVWRELETLAPGHDLVYFADQKYCPYGVRAPAEILSRGRHITQFLLRHGCQLIVVACNTASADALGRLRLDFPQTHFVGIEPAVKPATNLTRKRAVGVLATEPTLRGELFNQTRQKYAQGVKVIVRTAPGLVELIERGDIDSSGAEAVVRAAVAPIVNAGADVLVLGCTHYPFIAPLIRKLYGSSLQILDPSQAVALQAIRILRGHALLSSSGLDGARLFYTSGDPQAFATAMGKLIGVYSTVRQAE